MPKSKRDKIKEKHVAVENGINKAILHTLELAEMFKVHHPEYTDGYMNIAVMLDQAKGFIVKMKSFI